MIIHEYENSNNLVKRTLSNFCDTVSIKIKKRQKNFRNRKKTKNERNLILKSQIDKPNHKVIRNVYVLINLYY